MKPILQLVLAISIAVGMSTASATVVRSDDTRGKYIGKLVVEPLDDGRDLKLVEPFAYRDPDGELWSVPAGTVVNGASIPQAAWTLIGGPFSGRYRNASIIHDHYCVTKDKPWKKVHRVFYDAMTTSKVADWVRNIMYASVYQFGPRWEKGTRSVRACQRREGTKCVKWKTVEKEALIVSQPKFDPKQFAKLKALLKTKNLSPEEIEKLADKSLRANALKNLE